MGKEAIDLNLGLIQRPLPNNGPLISMVKSKPGVYYDVNGELCSDEMAASAGFDVRSGKRERSKAEAVAKATADIEARFREDVAAIDSKTDEELEEMIESPKKQPERSSPAKLKADAPADDDGSPFIVRTGTGEPRIVRAKQDGPVRVMEYDIRAHGWCVYDRDSGRKFGEGLEKRDALELLLEEE